MSAKKIIPSFGDFAFDNEQTINKKNNNKNSDIVEQNSDIVEQNSDIVEQNSDRVEYNGFIIYCVEHDDGCILKLNNNHDEEIDDAIDYAIDYIQMNHNEIAKALCGILNNKYNHRNCCLEFHGLSFNNKLMCHKNQKYYDMCAGGWKMEYYLNNIIKQNELKLLK
jgi:hypothetical protein